MKNKWIIFLLRNLQYLIVTVFFTVVVLGFVIGVRLALEMFIPGTLYFNLTIAAGFLGLAGIGYGTALAMKPIGIPVWPWVEEKDNVDNKEDKNGN